MNSGFTAAGARDVTEAMESEVASKRSQDRVVWLYHRILSRPPSEQELQVAVDFLQSQSGTNRFNRSGDGQRLRDFAHVLLMSNEFMFVD